MLRRSDQNKGIVAAGGGGDMGTTMSYIEDEGVEYAESGKKGDAGQK